MINEIKKVESHICWLFLQYKENVPNFKILTPEPQTLAYNVYLNTYNKHGLLTRSAMVLAVVRLISFKSQRLKQVGKRQKVNPVCRVFPERDCLLLGAF